MYAWNSTHVVAVSPELLANCKEGTCCDLLVRSKML
jgi:hypothetical protein